MYQLIQQIDSSIYSFFSSYQNPHWLDFNRAISFLGSTSFLLTVITLTGIYLLLKKWIREGVSFLIFFSLGLELNALLKLVFERPRPIPFAIHDHLHSFAFPSGHAFGATIVYMGLAWVICRSNSPHPPLKLRGGERGSYGYIYILASLLILAIGFSRIALGVHWTSDVLGGYFIGLIYFLIYRMGAKKFFARH